MSILIGVLLLVAGLVYLVRRLGARGQMTAAPLSDSAIREIERTGRLEGRDADGDAPLDDDEIAAAEEEFWAEEWDEPEEYER